MRFGSRWDEMLQKETEGLIPTSANPSESRVEGSLSAKKFAVATPLLSKRSGVACCVSLWAALMGSNAEKSTQLSPVVAQKNAGARETS